jgi:hypothetical protein
MHHVCCCLSGVHDSSVNGSGLKNCVPSGFAKELSPCYEIFHCYFPSSHREIIETLTLSGY